MDDGKGRTESIIAIAGGIIAIVTSLAAFWGALETAYTWSAARIWSLWTLAIFAAIALIGLVGYWFFARTNKGKNAWNSVRQLLSQLFTLRALIIFFLLLFVISVGALVYKKWSAPKSKSVTGTVYFSPCPGNAGREPAANVIVFLSARRDLISPATGQDGKFTISGIPTDLNVDYLTVRVGGQDYAPMAYQALGDYPVISRISNPCPTPPDIRECSTPWVEANANECVSADGQRMAEMKRFLLDCTLPAAQNKREALLTVELQNAGDVVITNAFVILPTASSGLYRNAMQGIEPRNSHRWLFTLPAEGLRVKLEVCLGSNNRAAAISMANLHTYYELR
jgi:hypothetical protein